MSVEERLAKYQMWVEKTDPQLSPPMMVAPEQWREAIIDLLNLLWAAHWTAKSPKTSKSDKARAKKASKASYRGLLAPASK